MNKEDRFESLEILLPREREDSVSMKELSKVMEISSRELRQFVLEARRNGLLILSDSKGYWESEDDQFIHTSDE